jgi:hypothetical protein
VTRELDARELHAEADAQERYRASRAYWIARSLPLTPREPNPGATRMPSTPCSTAVPESSTVSLSTRLISTWASW